MDAGEWKIMINIKGYIYLESPEKNLINIGFLPNLHPIQQKINTVEQKRLKEIEKKHKEFKVFPGNESWD
jgi:hypothetical protein